MTVKGFDHLVLRCADVGASLSWYTGSLGLEPVRVDEWGAGEAPFPSVRVDADTIIDLVPTGEPVTAGNVDHYCLVVTAATVAEVDDRRDVYRVVSGPDERFGARGIGWSIYVLDPDDNVIELRTYEPPIAR